MNKKREEVLDFIDRVFFGQNALAIKMAKMAGVESSFTLDKLPDEYEEVRKYLRENLK